MSSEVCSVAQRKTVCSYPWALRVIRRVVGGLFALRGWQFDTQCPAARKYVMVVAPHTSNWDFFLMVALGASLGRQVRFMGKHSLFVGPLGSVLRWLGGIAVERESRHNFVEQMVAQFADTDDMVLIIAPEGTRKPVPRWKAGFYHIAHGAGVPIVPVYLDYGAKRAGFAEPCWPSGSLHEDMPRIQQHYVAVQARHPAGDSSHPDKMR